MTSDYTYLPLFVYGTLMSAEPAHRLVASAVERMVLGRIPGLLLYDVGAYPLAAPGHGVVMGEIHWLRPANYRKLLVELELYEGSEYTRTRQMAYPNTSPLLPVEVWVFVGQPAQAAHLPVVVNGEWRAWRRL